HSESRFRSLTELSSDWYWEQDEHFRFVPVDNGDFNAEGEMQPHLGQAPWEMGALNMAESDWVAHRIELKARRTYRDLELQMQGADGQPYWMSLSGAPFFDEHGRFCGYRGV